MVTLSEVHYQYEQYLKAWFQVEEDEEGGGAMTSTNGQKKRY